MTGRGGGNGGDGDPGLVWRRSTYCTDATCVEVAWRKSTYSGNNGCVEVRHDDDRILLRDSKDPQGPVLSFTRREWDAFLAGIRGGEFDLPATLGTGSPSWVTYTQEVTFP